MSLVFKLAQLQRFISAETLLGRVVSSPAGSVTHARDGLLLTAWQHNLAQHGA